MKDGLKGENGQKQIEVNFLKEIRTEDIIITYKASRNIIKQSQLCDVETGGIFVGTMKPPTIVDAGKPGANSIHRPTKFTSDPGADKACLAEARKQYGDRVIPVGWWHKHPSGFNKPSNGDCHQAQKLVEEYNDGKPVLMGIVNHIQKLVRHKTTLYLYGLGPDGNLVEYDWKLISSHSPELFAALKKASLSPGTKKSDYWDDSDFQFYQNPIGRKRIKEELGNLKKAGWKVATKRRPQDKLLVLDLSRFNMNLRMILPPEYPLNPPIVFTDDGRRLLDLRALNQWNSLNCLTDITNEFVLSNNPYSLQQLPKSEPLSET